MRHMPPLEHALRTRTGDWPRSLFPDSAVFPKPWHPDGDTAFRRIPRTRVANSDRIIAHMKASGRLNVSTGSTTPDSAGKTSGVFLNVARPDDPQYTVSKTDGPKNLCVTTRHSAPYGAKVRIGSHMVPQGFPMNEYSDHKLHIVDPFDGTLTEVQFIVNTRRNPVLSALLNLAKLFGLGKGAGGYQCHGVKQYPLDVPSTDPVVHGSTAAGISNIETSLRRSDLLRGWRQMDSCGVPQAHAEEFVAPATGTDGRSFHPDAVRMGQVLRLTPNAFDRLAKGAGPSAVAVLECWRDHGIMVIDTSDNVAFSLDPDNDWDQDELAVLRTDVTLDDFEVWEL